MTVKYTFTVHFRTGHKEIILVEAPEEDIARVIDLYYNHAMNEEPLVLRLGQTIIRGSEIIAMKWEEVIDEV